MKFNLTRLTKTILGLLLAFCIWASAFIATDYFFSWLKPDISKSSLNFFRACLAPGWGGYYAVSLVNKYLPDANLKCVSIFLCVPISLIFVILSVYTMIFLGHKYESSFGDQMLQLSVGISTCLGVYFSYKNIHDTYY